MPASLVTPPSLPEPVSAAVTVAGGASVTVEVLLSTPEPDTAYMPLITLIADADLVVDHVVSKTTTSITVRVRNTNTLTARTGTVWATICR